MGIGSDTEKEIVEDRKLPRVVGHVHDDDSMEPVCSSRTPWQHVRGDERRSRRAHSCAEVLQVAEQGPQGGEDQISPDVYSDKQIQLSRVFRRVRAEID